MVNMPDSISLMETISADLAALTLAGVEDAESINEAERCNYFGWKEAKQYKLAILSAVKTEKLKAINVLVYQNGPTRILPSALAATDEVLDAEIHAKELWQWVNKKKYNSIPGYECDPFEELQSAKNEFISLRETLEILSKKYPSTDITTLAEWLIKKLCNENKLTVYMQELGGKLITYDDYLYDRWGVNAESDGFLLKLLARVVDDGHEAMKPSPEEFETEFSDDIPF